MIDRHIALMSTELALQAHQVRATATLLQEGCTVPFIARYRKEVTGSLDETVITAIRDRMAQLAELDKRRDAILCSLDERGLLTDDLKDRILAADKMAVLEDVYLPYRPKRRTRAMIAREKGLEPLAERIFSQQSFDVRAEAAHFVDPDKSVDSVDDALAGSRDIIAERINEDASARAAMRGLFLSKATVHSKVVRGKEEEGAKFSDYFDWEEDLARAAGHRLLALFRAEHQGIVSLQIRPDETAALQLLHRRFVKGTSSAAEQVSTAADDGYKRLMAPSLETEVRADAKTRADEEAIRVFSDNLRELLLAPPLGGKTCHGAGSGLSDRRKAGVPRRAGQAPVSRYRVSHARPTPGGRGSHQS